VASVALLAGVILWPSASSGGLGDTGTHEVGHVVFKGQANGLLLVKGQSRTRARVYLSLHDLRPNTAYDVIGSTRPCGKSLTNGSRLFGLDVKASQETDEWQNVVLRGSVARLGTMRSVRLIAEPFDGGATRTTCHVYEREQDAD
jgi:hypothetical protein